MCDAEKGVQTELGQVRGPTFHLLTPLMCLRVSHLWCTVGRGVSWNAGVWPGRPGEAAAMSRVTGVPRGLWLTLSFHQHGLGCPVHIPVLCDTDLTPGASPNRCGAHASGYRAALSCHQPLKRAARARQKRPVSLMSVCG